jgi:hypothetical protein
MCTRFVEKFCHQRVLSWQRNDHDCISTILETGPYIRGLVARPRQDLNSLFGYRYGGNAHTPISGVSPEGSLAIQLRNMLVVFI